MFDGKLAPMTPAQIATTVRLGARLQAGEMELAQLKRRVGAIREEAVRARRDLGELGKSSAAEATLIRLDAEQTAIAQKIGPLRREVIEMRLKRAAEVRAAMTPMIAETAEIAHRAAVVLRDALHRLGQVNQELSRAHAEQVWIGTTDLEPLLARLTQLARW